jgi:hypothetical protein
VRRLLSAHPAFWVFNSAQNVTTPSGSCLFNHRPKAEKYDIRSNARSRHLASDKSITCHGMLLTHASLL